VIFAARSMARRTSGSPLDHRGAPSRWLLPVLLSTTLLLTGTVAVVAVSLPGMRADLGMTDVSTSWVVNAYLLAYGGALVLGGRLGDIVGRRVTLLGGLALFVVGAGVGALAVDPVLLITARVLQGAGAALAAPAVLGVLTSADVGKPRAVALSAYTATTSAGFSAGLLAGGAIEQWLGWRWIFLASVPIASLLLAVSARVVPSHAGRDQPLDVLGAVAVTVGTAALVFGLVTAVQAVTRSLVGFLLAAVLLGAFVLRIRTTSYPLLPPAMFTDRARVGALVAMTLTGAANFGTIFVLTQHLSAMGLGPLMVGVVFLALSLPSTLGSLLARPVVARFGTRRVAAACRVLGALGALVLTRLSGWDDMNGWIIAGMVLVGLGSGGALLATTAQALAAVPAELTGAAVGTLQTCLQLGSAVGTALLVVVGAVASIDVVFAVVSGLLLAGILAMSLGVRASVG